MRVFISWSGEPSFKVAEELRRTLPLMLQDVETWGSFADIEAGARWASNIAFELGRADFAIICLTPENLGSQWIHYELGVLVQALSAAKICPFLIGFSPVALKGPLVQFQAVQATKDGTWRLIQSLNATSETARLDDIRLHEVFEQWWPRLEHAIARASELTKSADSGSKQKRQIPHSDRELLEEILARLAQPDTASRGSARADSEFVFLVHGRATATAESVARFVEKLGPRVVILQEQPNAGRTVIEKFEDHAGVAFAIVLMTGDDRGGLKDVALAQQKLRARQNVVLELGYFVARIGRRSVLVIHEDEVELPSDYTGVLYVPLDSGGAWRLALARELRAAGSTVDLNNAL